MDDVTLFSRDYMGFVGVTQVNAVLERRKAEIQAALADIERSETGVVEGRLRISKSKGTAQFYCVKDKGDHQGEYIPKTNVKYIRALAQKQYNEKAKMRLIKEQKLIEELIAFQKNESEEVWYEEKMTFRKKLVSPFGLTDAKLSRLWLSEDYRTNPYKPDELVYETERGEMVRTKSEMLLANMYYSLGIPYRYECALPLQNGITKYPDFTLLDNKRRMIIYHEHMGLIENEEYRRENIRKLDAYRDEGIYCGKNLLITYETKESPFNIGAIKRMMKDYFGV